MTPADRNRLVALKKAKKKLITQKEAALELGLSERHVRRLLKALEDVGDKAVVHALRGKPSNRKTDDETRQKAVQILSGDLYRGFGPTLASEHLAKRHKIRASRETVRHWMIEAKLWRAKPQQIERIHQWRQRRSRPGELVQWDTSEHDWLEGRGEKIYLISMIDDATSRLFARFVRHDSTEANMRVLREYLERYGRPLNFYTDKASLFQTTEKRTRDAPGQEQDPKQMPPTQIGRALWELHIAWIAAHSPQAKGRVERQFGTMQDRLVKEMRVAGVSSLEEANRYLEDEFLPWWNRTLAVDPANPDDAHRPVEKGMDLAAILSHVEERKVTNDYTVHFAGKLYQIERAGIVTGLRGGAVRVEKRLDGSIAMRFREQYLGIAACEARPKVASQKPAAKPRKTAPPRRGSDWNKYFDLKKAPKVWQAAQLSGARTQEPLP
jgi:hypothetical protein